MSEESSRPIAVVGMGELGSIFSAALLRTGRTIVPVLRGRSVESIAALDPELVLIAVGENDLSKVLSAMPIGLRGRVALLQNELSAEDWLAHQIVDPTVCVVWFEQKKQQPTRVIAPTPIAGPAASLLVAALKQKDIPALEISRDALDEELVRKNLYIVGSNVAGLVVDGTTGQLAREHREFARTLLNDVFDIECARLGRTLDREAMMTRVFQDFLADPNHRCKGRTAKERLERALARAERLKVAVPTLRMLSLGGSLPASPAERP